MKVYRCSKKILSVKNNPEQFLKGLTSNDLDKPQNAFLNIHGRIIAVFDQKKVNEDLFLIAVENDFVQPLTQHISRYLALSKTKVEGRDEKVYFDLVGDYQPGQDEHVFAQKQGQLVMTTKEWESNVSDEEFALFRLQHNIPIHGRDYRDELLLNVSEADQVSFTKGCYLGQEPISKVHNRSRPSWKLMVKYEDECTEEEKAKMTSKVKEPRTGRVKGFVFGKNDL